VRDGADIYFRLSVLGNGDPDVYIAVDAFPQLNSFNYASLVSEPAGQQSLVRVPSADLTVSRLVVGVFGFCCEASVVSLYATNTEAFLPASSPAFQWVTALLVIFYSCTFCF
jgi:hypothetical protein